jgi:hypothetical protein
LGAAPPTTQRIANAVNASSVVIWPNPNDGERINLSVEIGSEFDGTAQVDVFDMFGKKVMARTISVSGPSMNTTLELSGELASGLYMVNITMGEETFTERLIIQH